MIFNISPGPTFFYANQEMNKLVRITTVPLSLQKLLEGQLNFMQQEYEVVAVSSDEKRLKKLGEKIGVRTFAVEMTRKITPNKDIYAVWKLYLFLKKEQPLIVHAHTPKAGITGMLAAKMAGVPVRLYTVAGIPEADTREIKWKVMKKIERLTFACATKIFPNSLKMHDYLLQNNYALESKLKVIGKGSSNGIDTKHFDPGRYLQTEKKKFRQLNNIPGDDKVFIFVGRFVRDKGINELIAAFEKLHREFEGVSLLLVGFFEEKLDPLAVTTVKKIKEHPKILNVGYQDDVRPFFAYADILVFPSYREGFPNVVLQAAAMGLPAVVTNINGCNEIIRDGINGYIIPVRDTEALYQKMKKMLLNEKFWVSAGKESRKWIKENYERKDIWEALLAEYKQLEHEI